MIDGSRAYKPPVPSGEKQVFHGEEQCIDALYKNAWGRQRLRICQRLGRDRKTIFKPLGRDCPQAVGPPLRHRRRRADRGVALTNGGWDAPNAAVYRDFTLEPGETTTVRWLAIVPDVVLDDPSLFFLAYADNTGVPSEGTLSGMELALTNE